MAYGQKTNKQTKTKTKTSSCDPLTINYAVIRDYVVF